MKKNSGSALLDYIIPTAIVGIIVGLAIYSLLSNGSLLKFTAASSNIKVDLKKGLGQIGPDQKTVEIKAGSLGGTPKKPVKQCSGSTCVIDYGNLILTGLPSDIGAFTETAGTAGGTEAIIAAIEQIAKQMDDPNTPEDEGKDFRDLANLGHFIASYESSVEQYTKNCNIQSDPKTCMQKIWMASDGIGATLPANLIDVLPDYSTTKNYMQNNLISDFGYIVQSCKSNPSNCGANASPAAAFYTKYQEIMESKVDNNVKGVTKELHDYIVLLATNMDRQISNAAGNSATGGGYHPLTGEFENITYPKVTDLNQILHPQPSINTDLSSVLICAAGWKKDKGSDCK